MSQRLRQSKSGLRFQQALNPLMGPRPKKFESRFGYSGSVEPSESTSIISSDSVLGACDTLLKRTSPMALHLKI